MSWCEIYMDSTGALAIERHAGEWVFIPNRPVGRPRKDSPPPPPPRPTLLRDVLKVACPTAEITAVYLNGEEVPGGCQST